MIITIHQGSYSEEERAIAQEIVGYLRKLGLEVTPSFISNDPAHNVILRKLVDEGFPIHVEVK